jgi:hypothetical protein
MGCCDGSNEPLGYTTSSNFMISLIIRTPCTVAFVTYELVGTRVTTE